MCFEAMASASRTPTREPPCASRRAQVLKKEVQKTQGEEGEKNFEYRAMLINAIHSAAIKFPDSASMVVPVLMDFLGDANQSSAVEVVLFVREILETYPQLRESILKKLLNIFHTIHSSRVARVALWLVGEYCVDAEEVAQAFTVIKGCLGELPFLEETEQDAMGGAPAAQAPQPRAEGRPVVLADGSYASQVALEDSSVSEPGAPKLRGLLLGGDFFLATVVATTLSKLALRSRAHLPPQTVSITPPHPPPPLCTPTPSLAAHPAPPPIGPADVLKR